MKVMTTQGGVRSTGGSNQTSTGADEQNGNSDANSHPESKTPVVGRYPVSPEWDMQRGNTGGITQMNQRGFVGSDAAHEDICKHPSKEYDPASISIPGLNKP